MTWLYNIGRWFVEWKDAIVITLAGLDFAALAGLGIALFKQNKKVDNNTNATDTLNKSIEGNKNLTDDVHTIVRENAELKEELKELKHSEELLVTKLNAMLDVQSLVYATLKDEPTRVAVGSILANAKYNETSSRLKLKKQLEQLKKEVSEKNKLLEEKVNKTVTEAEEIVDNKTIATRY